MIPLVEVFTVLIGSCVTLSVVTGDDNITGVVFAVVLIHSVLVVLLFAAVLIHIVRVVLVFAVVDIRCVCMVLSNVVLTVDVTGVRSLMPAIMLF